MSDLAICIPARNELFLARTIQDILEHMEGDTEIIAVLDGAWADPPIPIHPKVTVIYFPQSIGQRAACNQAVRIATSKYIMKCDAHCAFDQGFDVKLMADMQDDFTMVPVMRNLHTFDWVCKNGHRRYQGPSDAPEQGKGLSLDTVGVCRECGAPATIDVVWIQKPSPQSRSYCFDSTPHFQYFNDYTHRREYKDALKHGHLTETMSLQGSCFMLTRDKYIELDVCGEDFGSWGSQGLEVAIKTWLSGGRVIVNHNTYYSHQFRTQGSDFGFPYSLSGRQVENAKKHARELFFNNKWPKQIHPMSWLVEKFWPVTGWTDDDLKKLKEHDNGFGVSPAVVPVERPIPVPRNTAGVVAAKDERRKGDKVTAGIVYYTDNLLSPTILHACQQQLQVSAKDRRIVSVSLAPLEFGDNIVLPLERSYLAMFMQILTGLEALDGCDYVFLAEHDVLYHPSHFEFTPERNDLYYYNLNTWKVDAHSGHAARWDTKQTAQLCGNRDLLIAHYRERVRRTKAKFDQMGNTHEYRHWIRNQGFEPGSHNRSERVDDVKSDTWMSEVANLDIRHDTNLTPSRWRQDQFRDQRNCRNWKEAEYVDGWYLPGEFDTLLKRKAQVVQFA